MLEFWKGHKPEENWGNCCRPNCQNQSMRCAINMCMRCCYLQHSHVDHLRPWVLLGGKESSTSYSSHHSPTCLCQQCVVTARLKARDTAASDASNLPAIYKPPEPEEPKLGDMTERDTMDWPLECHYVKAKTVWQGYYYE